MNGYLVDTSVMSSFAPDRPPVSVELQKWIVEQGARGTLFASSIVVLEIRRGIAKLRRSGGLSRADRLESWLASMITEFEENVLAVDVPVATLAGEIEDEAMAQGRSPGLADILIAATALVHGLTVLTSNARHFEVLGAAHIDPFSSQLPD